MSVRKRLEDARDRVASGWCQHDYTRVIDGKQCYCALGAIYSEGSMFSRAALQAGRLVGRVLPSGDTIPVWNDDPARTQDDVVAVFDAAIALYDKENPDVQAS